MSDFSDSDSPIKEEWRHVRLHAIDVIACLRIAFGPDYMEWRILPHCEHGIIEVPNLTFCAPYLEARAIQRVHSLYDSTPASKSEPDSN